MAIAWGVTVIVLSVVCWGGQAISWLRPATAERLTLTEAEADVDPAFYADVRGEAMWDTLTLWVMPVAGCTPCSQISPRGAHLALARHFRQAVWSTSSVSMKKPWAKTTGSPAFSRSKAPSHHDALR